MYEHRGRELHKREVTITGRLASMSRREAIRQIRSAGGRYADVPSDDTDFVVIGGDGPPLGPDGRPTYALRRARDLISIGAPITILEEADFVRMMKPQREAASLQHLYTIAQLSNILEEPVSKIRSWVRQGLIHPTKIEKRLCYFEFGQLSTARRLQQWIRSGITPARIQRSLAQIADWLGKPTSSLSDLEAISEDGTILVRLEDGRLADPNGQLLLDFHGAMKDHDAREAGCSMESGSVAVAAPPIHTLQPREETAEGWFRIGISAEENGQFDCAIEAYQRALGMGSPQPEVCFNLGNTFFAMHRNAEAAACFIQATEIDADYVEAWNNLGNALAEIGKYEDAIPAYRRALSISPHYADAHYNLAETMAVQGNLTGARQHWLAYLKQDPNSQWALKVRERLAELR